LPAIRELVLSPSFQEDPEWIASTLRPSIKPAEARQALDTLLELGLLVRTPEGTLRPKARVVSTGPETTGMHMTNDHAEMMRCAATAMTTVPQVDSDCTVVALAISDCAPSCVGAMAVWTSAAAPLQAGLEAVEQNICGAYDARACDLPIRLPCPSPPFTMSAVCRSNRCELADPQLP
jgi:hypothetical protein